MRHITATGYKIIAGVLQKHQDKLNLRKSKRLQQQLLDIVIDFIIVLEDDNPRFNKDKFIAYINRVKN